MVTARPVTAHDPSTGDGAREAGQTVEARTGGVYDPGGAGGVRDTEGAAPV